MSLKDVAERTRVPLRHLEAIEEGNFRALPSMTYCTGFSRAYARVVGLDEAKIVAQVREEIAEMGGLTQDAYAFDEPVDPDLVPPRRLAWTAALIGLLLVAAYAIWRMQLNTPPTDEQLRQQDQAAAAKAPASNAPSAQANRPVGPVVITAVDPVWLRIYDAGGNRLFEGTLQKDETYTVPPGANNPMILTGRPDALAVTVGGQAIPPLGGPERTIADVPVSAAALLDRARRAAAGENDGDDTGGNAAGNMAAPVQPSATRLTRPATARPRRESSAPATGEEPASAPASAPAPAVEPPAN